MMHRRDVSERLLALSIPLDLSPSQSLSVHRSLDLPAWSPPMGTALPLPFYPPVLDRDLLPLDRDESRVVVRMGSPFVPPFRDLIHDSDRDQIFHATRRHTCRIDLTPARRPRNQGTRNMAKVHAKINLKTAGGATARRNGRTTAAKAVTTPGNFVTTKSEEVRARLRRVKRGTRDGRKRLTEA